MTVLDELLVDLTSGDEARAEEAVAELVALGDTALTPVRDLLNSDDEDHRWWAVRTLAAAPPSQAVWLLPLLNDSASDVRQAVALGLCSHPDESAVEPLIGALSDTDSMVSSLAGTALVAIGKPAIPSLIEFPKDAAQNARINAVRAMAEIVDHSTIPALMAALEDDSTLIRHWAEEGLERLGLDMIYFKPE